MGQQTKGEHKENMNISKLAAGQYVCRIAGQNNSITKQIIKL